MRVEYHLEYSSKALREIDKKYPGGFASAQVRLNLQVIIEGQKEDVEKLVRLLGRHYNLR